MESITPANPQVREPGIGLARGSQSLTPVVEALAAELGIASLDTTDTTAMAASIAEAALVAFDLSELAGGARPDTEAVLAAALEAGVPVLFENTQAIEEFLPLIADVDLLNPVELQELLEAYEESDTMQGAMDAMADAMGLGVASQITLFVPEITADGLDMGYRVCMLGASLPADITDVSTAYELDGVPVGDEQALDDDEFEAVLPGLPDLDEELDLTKLAPSVIEYAVTDPESLVADIKELLEASAEASASRNVSEDGHWRSGEVGWSSPVPYGRVTNKRYYIDKRFSWRPCGKSQVVYMEVHAVVHLMLDQSHGGHQGRKIVWIATEDTHWDMGRTDNQEFDTETDQGYYLFKSLHEIGMVSAKNKWIEPGWLTIKDYAPSEKLDDKNQIVDLSAPCDYKNEYDRWATWRSEWSEFEDFWIWHSVPKERFGRIRWSMYMKRDGNENRVDSWDDMLVERANGDKVALRGSKTGRPNNDNYHLYPSCQLVLEGDENLDVNQRFQIWIKGYVRNTWWNMRTFRSDEKKHREDRLRVCVRFTVDTGAI